MNKYLKTLSLAVLASMSMTFVACSSDDDDEPEAPKPGTTVSEVFPAGVPSQVGNYMLTTNAQGQVTTIKDGSETVTFKYGTISRATTFDAVMEIRDTEYPSEDIDIYLQFNEKGFIKYALEVYVGSTDSDDDEWWFEYNGDGQLNKMKRSEGDNEVTTITYTNGDITKVSLVDNENTIPEVCTISYTDDATKTAIVNKGGIMLFDATLGIDMDEMDIAYFAGLLGKATKNLPVRISWEDGDEYETFSWTINSNGLPTQMVAKYHSSYGSSEEDKISFRW